MDKQFLDIFYEYVQQFNIQDEKIALKIAHTVRVANIARELATSMCLSKEDCELAYAIGLMHDIGRFEQIRKYQTFLDAKSVDHAQLGVDIIMANDKALLRKFIPDERLHSLVIQAIHHHNKYEIKDVYDKHTLLHCHLIRDADKLDIFYLSTFTSCEVLYECTKQQLEQDMISPQVYAQIMQKTSVLHASRKTKLDILVSHLAMVYDLKTEAAKEWLEKMDFITKIIQQFSFQTHEVQAEIQAILTQIQAYLAGKSTS